MAGAEDVWSGVTEGGISAADVRDGTVGGSGADAFGEGFVVGLDLGTSNSCMALWHLDKMRVKVSELGPARRTRLWSWFVRRRTAPRAAPTPALRRRVDSTRPHP